MRKKHPVWDNYIRDASNNCNVKATCKKCGQKMQGHVERLKEHLKKHYNESDSDVEFTGEKNAESLNESNSEKTATPKQQISSDRLFEYAK